MARAADNGGREICFVSAAPTGRLLKLENRACRWSKSRSICSTELVIPATRLQRIFSSLGALDECGRSDLYTSRGEFKSRVSRTLRDSHRKSNGENNVYQSVDSFIAVYGNSNCVEGNFLGDPMFCPFSRLASDYFLTEPEYYRR